MATLKKFTEVNPGARLNISLKRTTRMSLEMYLRYYVKTYGEKSERSELVENLLVAWFEQDTDFLTFVDRLSKAEKADIEVEAKKVEAKEAAKDSSSS